MGGSKEKIVYIENKQLSDSENFMNDFSKSDDLDLSQSHSNDRKPPN